MNEIIKGIREVGKTALAALAVVLVVCVFGMILWFFTKDDVVAKIVPEEVVIEEVTEKQELKEYAREQAELLKVNPDKFVQLITCESQWDPKAKNPESTARGLLQYLIGTWETTRSNYQGYSRFDPYASIREAVLDIANGQQSMWQECLDKDGINFYE